MVEISTLAERVLSGGALTFDEAHELLSRTDLDLYELFAQANRVRAAHFGRRVHLCSIVNAKMGGCPEDCSFCAQAARFHTGVEKKGFISTDEMLNASREAAAQGSSGIGLVTATRGFKVGPDLDKIAEGLRAITNDGQIEAHASLGLMGKEEFTVLKAAGLTEFNHNLETGRGFFDKICSTHSYDDRINTIKAAKELGIKTCVGGIFGLGESPYHRAELAFQLRELDVDEVPLNFLVQVDGTPLAKEGIETPTPLQLLQIVSVFRLVLPNKNIFICAGRKHLGDLQSMIFLAGASGIMIGDFLTTVNRSVADDLKMLSDLGFETTTCGKPLPVAQSLTKPSSTPVFAA